MIEKEIKTPNGRFIKTYRNLFTLEQRLNFFNFIKNSIFSVSGSDSDFDKNSEQIYSSFSFEDVKEMGFFATDGYKFLEKEYNLASREVNQYRVNLVTPLERNSIHLDYCAFTLLYYVNINWKMEYGGHTLFLEDDISDTIYTSLYEPGKLIMFDGNIPHTIIPPITSESGNRMSFVIQYK